MQKLRFIAGAGLLAAGLALVVACQPPAPPSFDCHDCNLLLISIDTLRADHLGCYGYERPTSPHVDALAARSLLFEQAHSASYHTADSHMSIFTGLFPSVHGVYNTKVRQAVRLPDAIETFPEALARAGFTTVGFHDGGNVSPAYGFDRGFKRYERVMSEASMVGWLEKEAAAAGRWFAFYHTYHTHDPYLPKPPNDTRYSTGEGLAFIGTKPELDRRLKELHPEGWNFEDLRKVYWGPVDGENPAHVQRIIDLYDGEIHEVDAMVGRVLDAATAAGGRTLVVVTSDHGESFWEHKAFLHDHLYEPLLHVPLILHHPDHPQGRRIAQRVSLVDLAPTLLEMLGVEGLAERQGRSMVALLRGEPWERTVFGEKLVSKESDGLWGNVSLIVGDRKLVYHRDRGAELFELDVDPGERTDRARDEPGPLREMLKQAQALARGNAALRARLVEGAENPEATLDEETLRELRALGYLE